MFFILCFFPIYWEQSSQLTNSYFQMGVEPSIVIIVVGLWYKSWLFLAADLFLVRHPEAASGALVAFSVPCLDR